MDRQAERLESIKAAGFGTLVAGIVSSIVLGINIWLSRTTTVASLSPSIPSELNHLGLTSYGLGSIGLLVSAALFGITYRYVVRNDRNSHLSSGAVGAFGLVRACAQLETGWNLHLHLVPLLLAAGESCLVFAVVAAGLNWCMQQGWIQTVRLEA